MLDNKVLELINKLEGMKYGNHLTSEGFISFNTAIDLAILEIKGHLVINEEDNPFSIEVYAEQMYPDYYNKDYYLRGDDRKDIVIETYNQLKEYGLIK